MATEIGSPPRFFHMPRFQHQAPRQLFYKRPDFAQQQAMQQLTFDGKRMRKAVNRKTIDYNPSVIKYLEVSLVLLLQVTKLCYFEKGKFLKCRIISISVVLELVGFQMRLITSTFFFNLCMNHLHKNYYS